MAGLLVTLLLLIGAEVVTNWTACLATAGADVAEIAAAAPPFLLGGESIFSLGESVLVTAAASLLSLVLREGWLAEGGPCGGTPSSRDLTQCMLMCLFKLNLVVNALVQLSQA